MIWGRVLELLVGKVGGEAVAMDQSFRIVFAIQKTSTKTPNRSTIRVYNANQNTRNVLHTPNSKAILRAGYSEADGLVTIFIGDILNVTTYVEGPDIITELDLGDGFLVSRDSFVSVGFEAGVSALAVMKGIAQNMGLVLRPVPEIKDRRYPGGFSYCGQASRALDKVCAYLGTEWSIQNNEVQVLLDGGTVQIKAVTLSTETGMIGSPEPNNKTFSEKRAKERGIIGGERTVEIIAESETGKKKKKYRVYGYSVASYLLPHVQPGSLVELDAKNVKGFFRVETLEHLGDTFGNDWRTDMVLRGLTNG